MSYYILAVKFEKADAWSVQFGDYEKEVVQEEALDSYEDAYKTKVLRVKDDRQSTTDDAIKQLNTK